MLVVLLLTTACVVPQCWDDIKPDTSALYFGKEYRGTFRVTEVIEDVHYHSALAFYTGDDGTEYTAILVILKENTEETWQVGQTYDIRFTFRSVFQGVTVFDVHEIMGKTKSTKELPARSVPTPVSNIGDPA